MESTLWSQEMGYKADRGALGIYYLPTRGEELFCGMNDIHNIRIKFLRVKHHFCSVPFFNTLSGQPFRASATISEDSPKTSGMLFIRIRQYNLTTTFKIEYL